MRGRVDQWEVRVFKMNKSIKNALAKGKAMRDELDEKAAQAAKEREILVKQELARKEKAIRDEAKLCLDQIPDKLVKAVANRKKSFSIVSSEDYDRLDAIRKLIEPKIKKMGLTLTETKGSGWVQIRFDPDYGYDQTYYELNVVVPAEEE